jgi:hypothetical protein
MEEDGENIVAMEKIMRKNKDSIGPQETTEERNFLNCHYSYVDFLSC